MNYELILKKYWGYDDFRGIQREIIESIGSGHDTLGLMPTGGGKSVTFQVPALSMDGVCIVITPLIALMKDQVHHLRQKGINAAAVYSGMQRDDIIRILENCILGSTKLLYVSPERLGSELFQTKLKHMQVSFITVDEAHCISQWGYDFRPSYLQIADIRRICPDVPVLALTATATPKVVEDICERLSIDEWQREKFNVYRMSFERKNLTYLVSYAVDKRTELIQLLEGEEGAAIVYVRSRRHAREIAEHLTEAGLSATFYHAGLEHAEKDKRQRDWQHDRVRIMVATNAFGMGIDKADVRIVAHYDLPDSIEAYFQEAGRAGRDGQPARAILLYNNADEPKLIKRVSDTFPEKDYIRKVYDHLAYYYQIATGDGFGVSREFNIDDFCHKFNHFPIRVHSALQILQRAGYIEYTEEQDNQARVKFLVTRDDLYRLRGENPNEEKVIVALLRNYGGLFADYGFIDESMIAYQCGMKSNEVYDILKTLSQKHIIHFIPRKQVPYIRYMQRREDSEHVSLPPAIYEERKSQYQERINAMLRYAKSNDKCRSRQLLEYFGEKDAKDCGQCDVCLNKQGDIITKDSLTDAKQKILLLLADQQRHHLTELFRLQLSNELIDEALRTLLDEENIQQQDGFLLLG
jgi:ATP-dependent DNA helicase RecQ